MVLGGVGCAGWCYEVLGAVLGGCAGWSWVVLDGVWVVLTWKKLHWAGRGREQQ